LDDVVPFGREVIYGVFEECSVEVFCPFGYLFSYPRGFFLFSFLLIGCPCSLFSSRFLYLVVLYRENDIPCNSFEMLSISFKM
jgi:hypothetical protein